MKKSLILVAVILIIIGGIFFFKPKIKAIGGLVEVMPTEPTPAPKCFGFLKVENVPDAILFTCYGMFY